MTRSRLVNYFTRWEAYGLIAMGAAYGTAKSGIGIAGVGTFRSDLIMKVCDLLRSLSFAMTLR